MEPTNTDVKPTVKFAQPSSYQIAVGLEQHTSEVPTGVKASVLKPRFKLVPYGAGKAISRGAILATHWLNLPLREGTIFVPYLAKQIETLADNYQRTHQDAFFEAYPDLLISKNNESWDTSSLRRSYKMLCKRVAHEVYHYINATAMLSGCLANIITLGRIDGEGYFKDFAQAFKWPKVNTETNWFSRFVKPLGMENYILNYSKLGIGRSQQETDIVSIGLWICDIFGNRGCHAIPLDNTYVRDNTVASLDSLQDDTSTEDDLQMRKLLQNMTEAIQQYGTVYTDNGDAAKTSYVSYVLNHGHPEKVPAAPIMPYIENGVQIQMGQGINTGSDNDGYWSFDLNRDGAQHLGTITPGSTDSNPGATWDNVIDKVWGAYYFWKKYLLTYFPQWTDPLSDWVKFFTSEVKLFEKSRTPQEYLNVIRNSDAFDIQSLMEAMAYKKNNAPNTATIVKWIPLFDDGTSSPSYRSDKWFELNYSRYETLEVSPADMLRKSQDFPHLTPSVFSKEAAGGSIQPAVLNTIPLIGTEFVLDSTGSVAPVGKYATMLDIASCANMNPEGTAVTGIGADVGEVKDFIKSDIASIFEELPFQPIIFQQPLIDVTDPYQCGFNVLLTENDPVGNEWRKVYTDKSNFLSVDGNADFVISNIGRTPLDDVNFMTSGTPFAIVDDSDESDGDSSVPHIANSKYFKAIKHALIFVGADIVAHPMMKMQLPTTGNPVGELTFRKADYSVGKIGEYIDALSAKIAALTTGTNVDFDPQSSNDMWQLVLATHSYAMATMPNNISHAAGLLNGNRNLQNVGYTQNITSFRYQYFKQSYGVVTPMTMTVPSLTQLAMAGSGAMARERIVSSEMPIYIGPEYDSFNEPMTVNADDFVKMCLMDTFHTPALFWVWFLENVKFSKIFLENGMPSFDPDANVNIPMSSAVKAAWGVASRCNVFYPGVEDTVPYWSLKPSVDAVATDQNFATMPYLTTNDLAVEPRKPGVTQKPNRQSVPGSKPILNRDTAAQSVFGRSSGEYKDTKYSGNHSRRNNKNKSWKGYKGKSNLESSTREQGTPNSEDLKDGTIDISTPKQDAEVKSKTAGLLGQTDSTQAMMNS